MSKIRVEYEDEHIVVLHKPAGVLSQEDSSGDRSIVSYARSFIVDGYLSLLHRLDRPVSGLIMLAKDKRSAALFSRLFRNGRVKKGYKAVVFGSMPDQEACLKNYILDREGKNSLVFNKKEQGSKEASLRYRVLAKGVYHDIAEYKGLFSLLSVNLITGRKHQIRAQLSALGNPIVADSRYFPQNEKLRKKMLACNFLQRGEIALCADYIGFPHPLKNGNIVEVQAPIPDYWVKIL